MVRFVFAVIIVLGFGYLGILYSSGLKRRALILEELKAMLQFFEINIKFMNLTVYDAVIAVSKTQGGIIKPFLENVALKIKNKTGEERMENIWASAAAESEDLMQLKKEDIEIIIEFSKNLGKGDTDIEIKNIHSAILRLDRNYLEALKFFTDNSKLYRGIGLAAGAFIAIILI